MAEEPTDNMRFLEAIHTLTEITNSSAELLQKLVAYSNASPQVKLGLVEAREVMLVQNSILRRLVEEEFLIEEQMKNCLDAIRNKE